MSPSLTPHLFSRPAIAVLAGLGIALAVAPDSFGAAGYENPGPQQAAQYLRPGQLAGAEWKVAPQATNDGVFNVYTVQSRFGSLQARGSVALARRAKEVEALAELEKVSKSDVFVDAVKASALAPVKIVTSFADQPVETVKGLGNGVKRLFGKTKFQVKEMSHDAKETVSSGGGDGGGGGSKTAEAKEATEAYAKKYLGLTGAERRWYAQVGVDPYTDNEALRKAVKEISRIEAASKFGMRFVGLPSIPGAREIGKAMDLVWKTDPWELRQRNRKILLDAGISEDAARAFEDNSAMSPTLQTALIQSLQDLAPVPGRQTIVARAADIDSETGARILVASTALLARLHRQTPLAEILGGANLPVARARDGRLMAVAPLEAVFWTEEVAETSTSFAGLYAGEKAAGRELLVVGVASPRVKSELQSLGWKLSDHWQSAPEDQASK